MNLLYKPDYAEATRTWTHYWNHELAQGRPLVLGRAIKEGVSFDWERDNPFALHYYNAVHGHWAEQLRRLETYFSSHEFLAEAMPYFGPDFGPDQMAAFLGGTLAFSENSPGTNWVHPIVESWADFHPTLDPNRPVWRQILEYARTMASHAQGRYLVATCDFHSNADVLSALRGPEQLCLDWLDQPEAVEGALRAVRQIYQPMYEGLHAASGCNAETGTIGWLPFWSPGRFATIQCDCICLVSPEISKRYIIPALEEEASYLDHCVYHLDGPTALPHLDMILGIEAIDAIQWVSGDGQPPMHTWIEVLQRIQKAGKGLIVYGSPEEVKTVSRQLQPTGVVYEVGTRPRQEIEDLCRWLKNNT